MPEMEDSSGDVSPAGGGETNLFGKYEVGRLLGCGAFAKVYHGRDVRTGQSAAIKVVSKQKVVKGGFTAHIKREISIMRRLRHPHIVRLFEVLATKSKIFFVMEFAKGGELFAKVAKGRFSEDLSRRYFQQLIAAVAYCHSRGVFHRDLKPENLLLDENWDLKVTDFGLAAVTGQIRPDGLLHTLCGTPAYVAPEILAKKGYDGAKVDVWSCGIILYVLNAGYLPFNDPNLMVMYRKIYKGDFHCPKWMSPDLKRFLSRLLDSNPDTRITVDEILADPWFRKGYKEIKIHNYEDLDEIKDGGDGDGGDKFLNAFDIISLSRGFDISNLFDCEREAASSRKDRFLSEESPERIVGKIEEVAKAEGLRARRKRRGWAMRLEGQDGHFIAGVDIHVHRLTEKVVLVEIKSAEMSDREIWKDKIRPHLNDIIYQLPERPAAGYN